MLFSIARLFLILPDPGAPLDRLDRVGQEGILRQMPPQAQT